MGGCLYVVATPIGNLEDITFRAVKTLKTVSCIACENISRTRILLAHFDIKGKKLIECSPANEKNSAKGILGLLESGNDIALVSDAGTPCISDPGVAVVSLAAENGCKIIPIPGVSALTTLLSVSGMGGEAYIFLGFLPKKEGAILKILQKYASIDAVLVIYESGRRIKKLLNLLKSVNTNADVTVGKELTKLYETLYRGNVAELEEVFQDEEKGEFVLALRFQNTFVLPAKEQPFSKKEKRREKLEERKV